MNYKNQYDKTTNKTIDICLNCELKECKWGECLKVKRPRRVKKGEKNDKGKV